MFVFVLFDMRKMNNRHIRRKHAMIANHYAILPHNWQNLKGLLFTVEYYLKVKDNPNYSGVLLPYIVRYKHQSITMG